MTRYDIILNKVPHIPPEFREIHDGGRISLFAHKDIPVANIVLRPRKNLYYETEKQALSVRVPGIDQAPMEHLYLWGAVVEALVKMANQKGAEGWEVVAVDVKVQDIDTVYAQCILRKAKQSALSSAPPLGPDEQRAGINPDYCPEHLKVLWRPSPATSATSSDQG